MSSLYPEGYRDPEWDGTESGFAGVVLPARIAAITEALNAKFADVLPEGMRFEFVSVDETATGDGAGQEPAP